MRSELFGSLPVIKAGMNKGRLDRQEVAKRYNMTKKQVYKAYNNWIQIFRMEGSTLTFEGYLNKLIEANISIEQLGNLNGCYQLSRYNDEGPYTEASCRFITQEENRREQYV